MSVIWPGASVIRSLCMCVRMRNRDSTSVRLLSWSLVRVTVQTSARRVRRTSLGATPSYLLSTCTCFLLSWKEISQSVTDTADTFLVAALLV